MGPAGTAVRLLQWLPAAASPADPRLELERLARGARRRAVPAGRLDGVPCRAACAAHHGGGADGSQGRRFTGAFKDGEEEG